MITIICVGKIKEKYFSDAILEYSKRISKYHKIKIIEVNDYEGSRALIKEEEEIKKHLKPKDFVITLEIEGQKLTSLELSKKIEKLFIGHSNLVFIIGGSYGISPNIKEISNYALSFSDLTFPHQLFRVILLEQIYRAFSIINNEKYHK